jgi:hypothetical protein
MRDDKHWGVLRPVQVRNFCEPTTTRIAGGLDFAAIGGKRKGREEPQSLRVESGAKHPVWKTQSNFESGPVVDPRSKPHSSRKSCSL